MKFMSLAIYPVEKAAEVTAASDKVWANMPKQTRPEVHHVLMSVPQFNVPPNSIISITISEDNSAEKIVERVYPVMLAGATMQVVPLLEVPVTGGVKVEKKYRG